MPKDDQAKRTIKLKPLTPKADNVADEKVEDTISMDRSELEEESTLQMSKPEVPGAKQTIKLRPSSNAPSEEAAPVAAPASPTIKLQPAGNGGDDQTVPLAKQTIKLVPKKPEDAATSASPSATNTKAVAKASAPTVQLDAKKAPTGTAVAMSKPSDPTVKLGGESPKKTLQLKKTPTASGPAAATGPDDGEATSSKRRSAPAAQDDDGVDEPGMVMTLAACATVGILIYLALLVGVQYRNDWEDQTGQPWEVPTLPEEK
jgi:hypothetical protein